MSIPKADNTDRFEKWKGHWGEIMMFLGKYLEGN